MVIDLGDREMAHGISYVALSKVRKFTNIGLKNGITKNRLCRVIKKQAKIKKRIERKNG